jgi:hypothetical protein
MRRSFYGQGAATPPLECLTVFSRVRILRVRAARFHDLLEVHTSSPSVARVMKRERMLLGRSETRSASYALHAWVAGWY